MDKEEQIDDIEAPREAAPYQMEHRFQEVDRAFAVLRNQTWLLLGFCLLLYLALLFGGLWIIRSQGKSVYVLGPQGQASLAWRQPDARDHRLEAEDHILRFHQLFYDLEPEADRIESQLRQALQWGDESVLREYDNLLEKDYYRQLVRWRIRQRLHMDSLDLNMDPAGFRFYGRLEIIRLSGSRYRTLVTQGEWRKGRRSRGNPHGLRLVNWRVVENEDLPQGEIEVKRK